MVDNSIDVQGVFLLKVCCAVATSVSSKGKIFKTDEQKC